MEKGVEGKETKENLLKTKIEKLTKIATACDELPEQYRLKCFEILANRAFLGGSVAPISAVQEKQAEQQTAETEFIIPLNVKALLSQHQVGEENLAKIFLICPPWKAH